MAFWRRKKEDQFVSLGLSRAAGEKAAPQTEAANEAPPSVPVEAESRSLDSAAGSQARTPWQTSVLGLDLSIEELQAREAALEQALIAADIGVPTTMHVLETVRRGISRREIDDIEKLKQSIKSELLSILHASELHGVASETSVPDTVAPYVMMIVGVNGVGKTTTIGKLAQRIKAEGNDVLICAADTFRAAATDQLAIWAERSGVPLIQQRQGTDPAAVL